MRTLHHALILALALLVQTSWAHAIAIYGITPDVVLLVVVFIGITSGQVEAIIFGFVSGLLLDVYNPEFMGVNALANSVVGFAVGYSRIGIVAEDWTVQGIVILVAGLLHDLLYFTFSSISTPTAILPQVVRYGLGTAVYSANVGIVISLALSLRINGGIHLHVRRFHG